MRVCVWMSIAVYLYNFTDFETSHIRFEYVTKYYLYLVMWGIFIFHVNTMASRFDKQ